MNFQTLYETYSQDVFRFALYLSGNWADAEDITAETFVRAWASSDSIRMATVKGYLFTIARNLFLQGLRKRTRHVALDELMVDPGGGPDRYVEKKQEYQAVLMRMQMLPEIDRAALLMRALGQTSYEEIGQSLGISLASVKVKIHRARVALAAVRMEGKL